MRKTVLALLLAATPALSQVRSDQPLAPVVLGAGPTRKESARVASDGTNFFAVWRTRTASNTVVLGGGRVSPAGELLDQPSILFASGEPSAFGKPDVVFVGGNFLVVYQAGTSVVTRRFARDGRPVDAEPVVIDHTAMKTWLATNRKNVFLSTAANRFRLLAADGTPLGAEHDVPISSYYSYAVGSDGGRYLIAYSDIDPHGSFYGTLFLLNEAGVIQVREQFSFPIGNDPRLLTIASNGSSFLLVTESFYVIVDANGNLGTPRLFGGDTMTATWSGSAYTLIGASAVYPPFDAAPPTGFEIDGLRVDAEGVPIGTIVSIASLPSYRPTAAFASASNGRDTIIITGDSDDNSDPGDWHTSAAIFKSLEQLDAEPANRRHVAIASSAREQAASSISSNATSSLVTWRESTGVDQAIVRAAFIAADGQIGAPIDIGVAYWKTQTAIASNGRDFLITYVDPRELLVARRVTLEGAVDSTPIIITNYLFGVLTAGLAAGWSGQAYVVTTAASATIWRVTPGGPTTNVVYGPLMAGPVEGPAIACATNGCSIAWHRPPWPYYYAGLNLFASTDAAANITVQPLLVTDADDATAAVSLPAPYGESLVVYSRDQSMFAERITASGVVIDTPKINGGVLVMKSETLFPLQSVAVVNDGLYFVEPDTYTAGRLYWTRIEPEPTPHVTSLVDLHQSVTFPLTLTASARNTYFLYTSGEDDESLMAPRLYLRTLASPVPQPGPVRRHAAH